MGTSLTGLTPSTTYDALIKVGDNGALSGTLKTLSDGLGNDSALALSTTDASIAGTLSVNGRIGQGVTLAASTDPSIQSRYGLFHGFDELNTTSNAVFNTASWRYIEDGFAAKYSSDSYNGTHNFFTAPTGLAGNAITFAERLTITNAGNVGIGTSAPNSKFEVSAGTTIYPINITSSSGAATTTGISMGSFAGLGGGANGSVYIASAHNHAATAQSDMVFYTHTGSALTEKGRFLASGGLTFNGDTAAANALDDYEEGTWTMGISFGGGSTGITYSVRTGTYTKIGRQVTVNGYLVLSSKGSSTGIAKITGLPFTVGNSDSNYSPATLWMAAVQFTNQFQGYGETNTTRIELWESTVLGTSTNLVDTDFSNNSNIMVSLTYFV